MAGPILASGEADSVFPTLRESGPAWCWQDALPVELVEAALGELGGQVHRVGLIQHVLLREEEGGEGECERTFKGPSVRWGVEQKEMKLREAGSVQATVQLKYAVRSPAVAWRSTT